MDRTLSRKHAVNVLGMSDTEFALRMVWDTRFPKPDSDGCFRATELIAWMRAQQSVERKGSEVR